MVAQSWDLAATIHHLSALGQGRMGADEVLSISGVTFDLSWGKTEAMQGLQMPVEAARRPRCAGPHTVVAVDAPDLKNTRRWSSPEAAMHQLAKKIYLLIRTTQELGEGQTLLTGLLGGGAFRNNRPLVLLLHLLMQQDQRMIFHNTVFTSFSAASTQALEDRIEGQAAMWLARLRALEPATMRHALHIIAAWELPSSTDDGDLA